MPASVCVSIEPEVEDCFVLHAVSDITMQNEKIEIKVTFVFMSYDSFQSL